MGELHRGGEGRGAERSGAKRSEAGRGAGGAGVRHHPNILWYYMRVGLAGATRTLGKLAEAPRRALPGPTARRCATCSGR
eukprot:7304272-Pyramimonas_sp.AAC.1